jgi:hypothetical protein
MAAATVAPESVADPQSEAAPPDTARPHVRRSPVAALLVAAAVAVLAAAAVLGLTDNGSKTSGGTAATGPTPTATAAALNERQVVDQIGRILAFSAQGRAQRVSGDFDAALANRRETLRRVRALQARTQLLSDPLDRLETAAVKTVQAVRAYKACGGFTCAPEATHASGQAKLAFTRAFNPLAQRYLHRTYGAADF